MPRFHNDPELPPPAFPGSHVVLDDRYAFVSGLVAADLVDAQKWIGDVGAETRGVLEALQRMLAVHGLSLDHVVRVDVHLADLDDITAMDAVYRGFFGRARLPARTCTESPRLCGGCRVEVTLLARLP